MKVDPGRLKADKSEGVSRLEKLGYVLTWSKPGYGMETWTYVPEEGRSWHIDIDCVFGVLSEYAKDSQGRHPARYMTVSEMAAASIRLSELSITSRYSVGEIDREVINREAARMVDLSKEPE